MGIVRGLSTLLQLIKVSKTYSNLHEISHLPLQINDSPRYPYRGLMLDTSRRFYDLDTIKQVIYVASAAKFNVFHWHIVDDDSFPMNVTDYPSLTKNAAFTANQVYSISDMADIVSYATTLGVRVIPEFDNPGHTRSIGLDPFFKDIIRCFIKEWPYTVSGAYKIYGGPPTGVMDPSYVATYDLLQSILTELNSIFPDTMIHLGGDEVSTSCFN
jgi:hexosaminidase